MRILTVSDLQLNAQNQEKMSLKTFHKWQDDRLLKLEDFLDKAQQYHVQKVFFVGTLFGQNTVPEKIIDKFVEVVSSEKELQVFALSFFDEYQLLSYRNDIPGNFHLICIDASDHKQIDDLNITLDHGRADVSAEDWNGIVNRNEDGFEFNGVKIPSFEPVGFDDMEGKTFGFLICDTSKDTDAAEVVSDQKYKYISTELKIEPEDSQEDIVEKINSISKNVDLDTFLRVTITGKSAFGITINADGIRNKLRNQVFNTEVYDNSIMDVDREMFENDISLRSEFVRLALDDDSLSEAERNRLISYGWNALSGKEMTEE